jgi:hypothetical protein
MLSLLVCALMLVAMPAASSAVGRSLGLRGAMNIFAKNNANATSVLCRITMFDTLILSKQNISSTREQTTCLPIVNEEEMDLDFSIDLPEDLVKANIADIEMGKLLVKVSGAELVDEKLVIGKRPQFEVVHDHRLRHLQERHLQSSGIMTLAVIRISTSDAAPTSSAVTLKTALFGGIVNFARQYESCSFWQTQVENGWFKCGRCAIAQQGIRLCQLGRARDGGATATQGPKWRQRRFVHGQQGIHVPATGNWRLGRQRRCRPLAGPIQQ